MQTETVEKKTMQSIVPAVNILETPVSYVVSLDISGAAKESIKVNIENNILIVAAPVVKSLETENIEKQYYREFSLANDIDVQTVDAKYDLGILAVALNKKHQYLPKQITVK